MDRPTNQDMSDVSASREPPYLVKDDRSFRTFQRIARDPRALGSIGPVLDLQTR